MIAASTRIINWQMIGLLIGGIIWGIMGDKKGTALCIIWVDHVVFCCQFPYRLCDFSGSICTAQDLSPVSASPGNSVRVSRWSVNYCPKTKEGIGTSLVAGIGLFGAVFAYFIYKVSGDWRFCYKIGGGLGIVLLLLRISVAESGMFNSVKTQNVQQGKYADVFQ